MSYDIYYSDGGSAGPFETIAEAITGALRRLDGEAAPTTYVSVEVRPSEAEYRGGYAEKHEGSFYVTKRENNFEVRDHDYTSFPWYKETAGVFNVNKRSRNGNNGAHWIITNKMTGRSRRIGPVQLRGKNYSDVARAEAGTLNREWYAQLLRK